MPVSTSTQQAFRIVASDMDGTVLNPSKKLTQYTMETLFKLYTQFNVPFIFATGRHYGSVLDARGDLLKFMEKRLGEERRKGNAASLATSSSEISFYLISSNGARIHGPRPPSSTTSAPAPPGDSNEPIVSHNIPVAYMESLIEEFAVPHCARMNVARETEHQVCVCAYTNHEWFMNDYMFDPMETIQANFHMTPKVVTAAAGGGGASPTEVARSVLDQFPREQVGKLCFICHDREFLTQLEHDLRARFGPSALSIALSSDRCLDIMPGGISKASGLEEVVQILNSSGGGRNYGMQDIIAFGDSMNDKEMLLSVGHGCVMANAQERLKEEVLAESADASKVEVIPHTNTEDGVARKLRSAFGIADSE